MRWSGIILSPFFFGFALNGWRCGVLHLDPVTRSTRGVRRPKTLRYDAFAAQLAGVVKYDGAFDVEVPVKRDAAMRFAKQLFEHQLAVLDRLPPQVPTVDFEQVERAKRCGMTVSILLDQFEYGEALVVSDGSFPIDQA
jgi:hypothetical protein